jgi:hypothetical protein
MATAPLEAHNQLKIPSKLAEASGWGKGRGREIVLRPTNYESNNSHVFKNFMQTSSCLD